MTNEELIEKLHRCIPHCWDGCSQKCELFNAPNCHEALASTAADALEAADEKIADYTAAIEALDDSNDAYIKENERLKQRIAQLEDDLRNSTISNPERFKIYGYTLRDLILFAELCKRNDVLEADLKKAAWNFELAVRAVMNERAEIVKNTMDEISVRFTPDFEKAYEEMMQNCGARMRGEQDEQQTQRRGW